MKGKAGEEARCVSHLKVRGAHRPAGGEGSPVKLAFKRASLCWRQGVGKVCTAEPLL